MKKSTIPYLKENLCAVLSIYNPDDISDKEVLESFAKMIGSGKILWTKEDIVKAFGIQKVAVLHAIKDLSLKPLIYKQRGARFTIFQVVLILNKIAEESYKIEYYGI